MRVWASRLLVVIAALASIATSRKKWELSASAPDGMPTEATGSNALRITIEASAQPEVHCDFPSGPYASRWLPPELTTPPSYLYMCPPGGKLGEVTLSGPVTGGGCSGKEQNPPKDTALRIAKTELVPMWNASVEDSFEIASDKDVHFTVESPRTSFVVATVEGDSKKHIRVSSWGDNRHGISLDPGAGSAKIFATVRVKATVFGPCEGACTKPDDEPLKIVRDP
jgi:hypothetical protein